MKTKTIIVQFSLTREQAANRVGPPGWEALAINVGPQNVTPIGHRFRVVADGDGIHAYFQDTDEAGDARWTMLWRLGDGVIPMFRHIGMRLDYDFAVGEAFRLLALVPDGPNKRLLERTNGSILIDFCNA